MADEDNNEAASRRAAATFTLGMRRSSSDPAIKALSRAEAEARLDLAAAIQAWDAATAEGGYGIYHQHEVEKAKDAYAQALADLVRGEAGPYLAKRHHSGEGERQ